MAVEVAKIELKHAWKGPQGGGPVIAIVDLGE